MSLEYQIKSGLNESEKIKTTGQSSNMIGTSKILRDYSSYLRNDKSTVVEEKESLDEKANE